MSGVEIEVIGLDDLLSRMRKAPEVVQDEMVKGVDRMTLQGQALSQKTVGSDTGHLRRSITTQKATFAGGEAVGSWGTNVPYAQWHERGRGPGRMPPISAIAGWARRHGVDAYLIARAIGRKGTTGKWFMRDARAAIVPKVQEEFKAVVQRIVIRMGGG